MSGSNIEKIKCPHCHKEGEMCIWNSVNVDLNPELKEKIFSGELFTYHCPHCGEEVGVPAGMLYYDMTHKFMILFDFFKPDDYDYPPLEISLPKISNADECTLRAVFGFNRFREKIRILEQGLNDIAIERMKYMMKYIVCPDVAKSGYEIFFEKITETTGNSNSSQISFHIYDDEGKLTMRSSIDMDRYYQYCLSCKLDPRMTIGGFCCVDEGWMSKHLKEEWK